MLAVAGVALRGAGCREVLDLCPRLVPLLPLPWKCPLSRRSSHRPPLGENPEGPLKLLLESKGDICHLEDPGVPALRASHGWVESFVLSLGVGTGVLPRTCSQGGVA